MLVFVTGCPVTPPPTPCTEDADCLDDELFCNGDEVCLDTDVCGHSGDPCDADAGEVCNEDTDHCDECTVDADCDDGLYCNGVETCTGAECVAGTSPCAADEVCDEDNDACVECLADADCDDGLYCNGDETCGADGACVAGTDPCTADQACDEENDVCVEPECAVAADCDDGLFCTGEETCVNQLCVAGTDPCAATAQLCDEANEACVDCLTDADCADDLICVEGVCIEEVACTEDADCDDGLYCNGAETCDLTTDPENPVCVDGDRPCDDTDADGNVITCDDGAAEECSEGDATYVCSACEVECIPFTEVTDSLLGTSGDDVFCAPTIFDSGTFPTYTNGDAAQGLAGDDILNATLFVTGVATTSVTLSGIETLNFTDAGTAVTTVDGSNFSDVTVINSVGSVQILTLNPLKTVPDFGITNSTKGMAATFTAAATIGTTDDTTLTLSNATDGAFTVATTAGTNAGLETVSIVSEGTTANKLTGVTETGGTSLVTLNISGSTALTLETVDSTFTTIDGSAATGDITLGTGSMPETAPLYVAFQAVAGDLKYVKTGSGDDTIIFMDALTAIDFDSTTANEGIDAGAGTDTVQMFPSASLFASGFALTGVETLKIAADGSALTVNLAEADVLASVVNDANASSEVITLSTTATIPDLTFTGNGVQTASQIFDGFTFSFGSGVTTTASDSMDIVIGNGGLTLD
ncbi:MAG: hypothetical protein WBE26_16065, partial [Phycisphaerae bacterium]